VRFTEKGLAFVATREAIVLTAYPDSHMLAVGMGQNDPALKPGDTITLEQAIALYLHEMERISRFLEMLFSSVTLLPQHWDALGSATYNCGTGTMRNNTALIGAVIDYRDNPDDRHKRDLAAFELVQMHPADKPIPFNLSRRCREALVFTAGDYGDVSTVQLWPAGKSPKNTPPDPPQVVPMPTFLRQ
jgi:GH24 family phage-related lysozyme (muramidase)